jgi:orotidine-5'-phosphate decarboxylase
MDHSNRFLEKIDRAWQTRRSALCVGLDPVPERLPEHLERSPRGVLDFCRQIIESTADLVCCYKPNLAYFLSLGPEGFAVLADVCRAVPEHAGVLLDAKFGDVDHTSAAYARAAFEILDADAVTLNPYLGRDALDPFLAYSDRFLFVLVRTSNAGAAVIQEAQLSDTQQPLFQHVAACLQAWDPVRIGFVVGATMLGQTAQLRRAHPDAWMLMPGIGAQGARAEDVLPVALRADGRGVVIPVSRSVLFASSGKDFAAAGRSELERLLDAFTTLGS